MVAFSELTLALAVIVLCRSFLYLVTLLLLSVYDLVYSRITLHISWNVCFLVSRVQNGSADKCTYKILPVLVVQGSVYNH